jgi:dTDP-4-dehydrorhamnose 3,5-epimerase-like enzyme
MAYFNNLTVGGTAKFLQDVKWPGLKSTAEELNALHSEEGLVDGFIFTKDTPYDEVIEDEYYNVKNKSFGLIKDNYYTFKYKRNGKISQRS